MKLLFRLLLYLDIFSYLYHHLSDACHIDPDVIPSTVKIKKKIVQDNDHSGSSSAIYKFVAFLMNFYLQRSGGEAKLTGCNGTKMLIELKKKPNKTNNNNNMTGYTYSVVNQFHYQIIHKL